MQSSIPHKISSISILALGLVIGLTGPASAQSTIYVDDDGPGEPLFGDQNPSISDPLEDGTTLHPYDTINEALAVAISGDTIEVWHGLYLEFSTVNLLGKQVTLISAVDTDPADEALIQESIIDASNFSSHVMQCISGEGPGTIIDGFTMRNGNANGVSPNERGGGLYINGSSPIVRNCVFENNFALIAGGGLYSNAGNPVIENCQFTMNTCNASGGAAYLNASITQMTNCTFIQNDASTVQGGAILAWNGLLIVQGGTFVGNTSVTFGGAVALMSGVVSTIDDCRFLGNFSGDGGANGRGGAIYTMAGSGTTILNATFSGNQCTKFGGAVYMSLPITLLNCTFSQNNAQNFTAISTTTGAQIKNCIIWGNASGLIPLSTPGTVSYSNVEGGFAGAGNIGTDTMHNPLFVNPLGPDGMAGTLDDDLRLMAGSPSIDGGDTNQMPSTEDTDLDGLPRVLNDDATVIKIGVAVHGYYIDMGAYEFQPDPPVNAACPQDIAPAGGGNGVVNIDDLVNLLSAFGACP